ncbi:thioredoxin [Aureibacter tunicatorum]|uniref:Thioredoxin n=1 Tax=Aureibacter tunicatorum TaxID=866807 RepID=A0AAE4BT56_9BACT|nr:thioredoxin [Aureibacter tunicatorum]MDR6239172.1 thioredoxin 1 [Aureibacter tunicatorum]BDD04902.1 thioredoxin [Aureibacter tunicatorum]
MKGNFNKLVNSKQPVLIDFYADWCGPCQTLSPIIKEISEEYAGKLKVIKVNVDKNQALAARFSIRSIPTLMMYKSGMQLFKKAGLMTKAELKKVVEKHV